MVLSCGCDDIWMPYEKRCIPCRNRISLVAQDLIDRDRGKWVRNRAFGTGLGPEAHAEAQEAGRLQEEYERSRSEPKEYIARGGRK